jgi:hypothetical protein
MDVEGSATVEVGSGASVTTSSSVNSGTLKLDNAITDDPSDPGNRETYQAENLFMIDGGGGGNADAIHITNQGSFERGMVVGDAHTGNTTVRRVVGDDGANVTVSGNVSNMRSIVADDIQAKNLSSKRGLSANIVADGTLVIGNAATGEGLTGIIDIEGGGNLTFGSTAKPRTLNVDRIHINDSLKLNNFGTCTTGCSN